MTLAIGGSSSAKPAHGELWVNVRDYGAKPDGLTDNSTAFQAAIDDLTSKLKYNFSKGIVFVPSGPNVYTVRKPIWVDADNIEIRGEGWGSTVAMDNYAKHNVFQFGLKRVEHTTINGSTVPLQIDSTNRPDLYGKLDTSAVASAGTMWGIRTNGNSFAQFQATPLNAGVATVADRFTSDNWGDTSKLTIEFCVEPPDGQPFPSYSPLVGLGSYLDYPSPFVVSIWDDPKKVMVQFRTSDIPHDHVSPKRFFSFSLAGATAPYRIAIQIDIDNAVATAYVNGLQVVLGDMTNMSTTSSPPFSPNTGLKFVRNEFAPFVIGSASIANPIGGTTGVDLRLYGLRLSNSIRYLNNGPGQPQQRVDSPTTAINDNYSYFSSDTSTICFLKGSDAPTTAGRLISVQHGKTAVVDAISSGFFLHAIYPTPCVGNAIRDIQVAASLGYGQAISVGNALELTIENVKAVYGYHGVGSFYSVANYIIYLTHCYLQGSDAAYFGVQQIVYAKDIYCGSAGRATIRMVGGNGDFQNVFVGFPSAYTESVFKAYDGSYGGVFTLRNLGVDFEGQWMSQAAIYCEAVHGAPATSLTLRDINLGTIGPKAALVMLKDTAVNNFQVRRSWLSIDNLQAQTDVYNAAIDVDGPNWHGEMRGVALTGPQINHRQRWGKATNIVIRDTKFTAPPRSYLWYSGAHILDVRNPADGQFTQWRCVSTGTYGTSTPPRWLGLTTLNMTPNSLAAYFLNHAYITISLS